MLHVVTRRLLTLDHYLLICILMSYNIRLIPQTFTYLLMTQTFSIQTYDLYYRLDSSKPIPVYSPWGITHIFLVVVLVKSLFSRMHEKLSEQNYTVTLKMASVSKNRQKTKQTQHTWHAHAKAMYDRMCTLWYVQSYMHYNVQMPFALEVHCCQKNSLAFILQVLEYFVFLSEGPTNSISWHLCCKLER